MSVIWDSVKVGAGIIAALEDYLPDAIDTVNSNYTDDEIVIVEPVAYHFNHEDLPADGVGPYVIVMDDPSGDEFDEITFITSSVKAQFDVGILWRYDGNPADLHAVRARYQGALHLALQNYLCANHPGAPFDAAVTGVDIARADSSSALSGISAITLIVHGFQG